MRPARRLDRVAVSPIRRLAEMAPPGALPLGLGEPSWGLPRPAREALAALAAEEGPCAYGPNRGLPVLRRAVARHFQAEEEEVAVTAGSEEALLCLALAWLNPGDRVLVPDPGYPAYAALARLAGALPVPYPLRPETGFRPDWNRLESLLRRSRRCRMLVVNTPSNPTGAAWTAADLGRAAALCGEAGVLLVSDEVYGPLHLGEPPSSVRSVAGDAVAVGSVSKAWGAPGLRVGWMMGPRRWLDPAATVHAYAVTAASALSQRLAAALLDASPEVLPAARASLRERWEALAGAAGTGFGGPPLPPAGGFYWWVQLPCNSSNSMEFCIRALQEAGVVTVPGSAFGKAGEGWLRVSFAASPGQVRAGVGRLRPLWGGAWPEVGA